MAKQGPRDALPASPCRTTIYRCPVVLLALHRDSQLHDFLQSARAGTARLVYLWERVQRTTDGPIRSGKIQPSTSHGRLNGRLRLPVVSTLRFAPPTPESVGRAGEQT